MTLQELLRNHARPLTDLIQKTAEDLSRYGAERAAAAVRAARAHEEAKALHQRVAENTGVRDALEIEISKLEAEQRSIEEEISKLAIQRRTLEQQIGTNRAKAMEVGNEVSGLNEQMQEQRTLKRRESTAAEALEDSITECEQGLARLEGRLVRARKQAFGEYLDSVWSSLSQLDVKDAQVEVGANALAELEKARHRDPEIADLWEARAEWSRILSSAGPVLVREEAKRQLAEVDKRLNELFPNALSASVAQQRTSELEELFYRFDAKRGRFQIVLPLAPLLWSELADGSSEDACDLAMRLVWGFSKSFPRSRYDTQIDQVPYGVLFSVRAEPSAFDELEAPKVALKGGGSVAFVLSGLPSELSELLSDED